MWVAINVKNNSKLNLIRNSLAKILGSNLKFFAPKIQIQKLKSNKFIYKDFFVLGNYVLIYHEDLKRKIVFNQIQYLRGIKYILNSFDCCQKEIQDFVERCTKNEDKKGYLNQNFFYLKKGNEIKFTSGPFVNFVSELIHTQKNKFIFLAGKYKILVNKNQNCISLG